MDNIVKPSLGHLSARDWRGTVIVNGMDVSDRSLGVYVAGERPVAVALLIRDSGGRIVWNAEGDDYMMEIVGPPIAFRFTRREEMAHHG